MHPTYPLVLTRPWVGQKQKLTRYAFPTTSDVHSILSQAARWYQRPVQRCIPSYQNSNIPECFYRVTLPSWAPTVQRIAPGDTAPDGVRPSVIVSTSCLVHDSGIFVASYALIAPAWLSTVNCTRAESRGGRLRPQSCFNHAEAVALMSAYRCVDEASD